MNAFAYQKDNNEIIITELKDKNIVDVVIPDTIDGLPVVEVWRSCFWNNLKIRSVKMGQYIRSVQENSFEKCTNLETIIWPDECEVPKYCFDCCISLKNFRVLSEANLKEDINLPESIKKIGEYAFARCLKIEKIDWKTKCDIPAGCFKDCANLSHFDFSNVKKIGIEAFGDSGLTELHITPNVKEVESYAFCKCSELEKVVWHKGLDVPASAFRGCSKLLDFDFTIIERIGVHAFESTGLKEVSLKNIKEVGIYAFSCCKSLKKVEWNKDLNIPDDCFGYCSVLSNFDFKNIKKIGYEAFWHSGLKEVNLESDAEEVGGRAFEGCQNLERVKWANGMDIPHHCFADCEKLKEFNFSNVKKISRCAFEGSALTSIHLEGKIRFWNKCFARCHNLLKVEWLVDSSIKNDYFEGCDNLEEIIISDKVEEIATDAFKSSPNAEISFV